MAIRHRTIKKPILRDVVDEGTGEITKVPDTLEYIKFDLGNWFKMMRYEDEVSMIPFEFLGKQFLVFYMILKRVVWEDCTIDIGTSCKQSITSFAKIKDGMIAKYLEKYCKGRLLRKIKGTSYMVNPLYFYIGDSATQQNLIRKFNNHGI